MRHAHSPISALGMRKAPIRTKGVHGAVHAMPREAAAVATLCRGCIVVGMVVVVIIIDGRAVLGGLLVTADTGDRNVGLAGRGDLKVGGSPGPGAGKVIERIYATGVADCVQA